MPFPLLALLVVGGGIAAAAASSSSSSSSASIRLTLLPGVIGGGPGKPPPNLTKATDAELSAAFADAQTRSIAARKASEAEGAAKVADYSDKIAVALSVLGPVGVAAGVYAKALFSWGYETGQKIAHMLYGDPGWNDPDQVERAKNSVARTLALGFVVPTFDDSMDAGAEGYADRLDADLALLQSPDMPAIWPSFVSWVGSHPNDPAIQDATYLGLFPSTLYGATHLRPQAAALGRLLARAYGRDPERAQRAATDAIAAIWQLPELRSQDGGARALAFLVSRVLAS